VVGIMQQDGIDQLTRGLNEIIDVVNDIADDYPIGERAKNLRAVSQFLERTYFPPDSSILMFKLVVEENVRIISIDVLMRQFHF